MFKHLQIGSDGMNSAVRKAANFHTVSLKYDQKAVVAILGIEEVKILNTVLFNIFVTFTAVKLAP